MANEKNLIPYRKGERSREEAEKSGRKGGIASGKARSAKAMFNRLLQQCPEEVLSGKALDAIRETGVDPGGKTFMELCALTTLLQWSQGDMRAGKLAMEIAGQDAAAERNQLEKEKLKMERERMDAENQRPEDVPRIIDRRPED